MNVDKDKWLSYLYYANITIYKAVLLLPINLFYTYMVAAVRSNYPKKNSNSLSLQYNQS